MNKADLPLITVVLAVLALACALAVAATGAAHPARAPSLVLTGLLLAAAGGVVRAPAWATRGRPNGNPFAYSALAALALGGATSLVIAVISR